MPIIDIFLQLVPIRYTPVHHEKSSPFWWAFLMADFQVESKDLFSDLKIGRSKLEELASE